MHGWFVWVKLPAPMLLCRIHLFSHSKNTLTKLASFSRERVSPLVMSQRAPIPHFQFFCFVFLSPCEHASGPAKHHALVARSKQRANYGNSGFLGGRDGSVLDNQSCEATTPESGMEEQPGGPGGKWALIFDLSNIYIPSSSSPPSLYRKLHPPRLRFAHRLPSSSPAPSFFSVLLLFLLPPRPSYCKS